MGGEGNLGLSVGMAGAVKDKRVCIREVYHVTVNHGTQANCTVPTYSQQEKSCKDRRAI